MIEADEKKSLEVLSDARGEFHAALVKTRSIDLKTASSRTKSYVMALYEYMARLVKLDVSEACENNPVLFQNNIFEGFEGEDYADKNPWDNMIHSPEKDKAIKKNIAGLEEKRAAKRAGGRG